MTHPAINVVGERVYAEIEPVTYADQGYNWPLLRFVDAWTKPLEVLDLLVRDTDTDIGWSAALDVVRAEDAWLVWLAQFAGIRNISGYTAVNLRPAISRMDGFKRGRPQTIIDVAKTTLTGTKSVQLVERHGSAWRLTVTVLSSECPDPALTLSKVLEQKPAGIVMALGVVVGNTYNDLYNTHATYTVVGSVFTDYNDILSDPTQT